MSPKSPRSPTTSLPSPPSSPSPSPPTSPTFPISSTSHASPISVQSPPSVRHHHSDAKRPRSVSLPPLGSPKPYVSPGKRRRTQSDPITLSHTPAGDTLEDDVFELVRKSPGHNSSFGDSGPRMAYPMERERTNLPSSKSLVNGRRGKWARRGKIRARTGLSPPRTEKESPASSSRSSDISGTLHRLPKDTTNPDEINAIVTPIAGPSNTFHGPLRTPSPVQKIDFDFKRRSVHLSSNSHIIARGKTLLSTTPIFPTLNTALLNTHCGGCLMNAKGISELSGKSVAWCENQMIRCGGCKVMRFCSLKCYANNAYTHFEECRALKRHRFSVPPTLVRLVAKVIWDRDRIKEYRDPVPDHFAPKSIEGSNQWQTERLIEEVERFMVVKIKLDDGQYFLYDREELIELVRRVQTCVIPLHDTSANFVGMGLSRPVSSFQHSCRPNAMVVFPVGPTTKMGMRLVALSPIAPGQEVTISYIDRGLPRYLRDNALLPFGFEHDNACTSCLERVVDLTWAVRHKKCEGQGLIPLFEEDDMEMLDPRVSTSLCTGCPKHSWAFVEDTMYFEVMKTLGGIWEQEAEGVGVSLSELGQTNIMSEYALLKGQLRQLLSEFPATGYRIPYLLHRLGRIALIISPATDITLLTALTSLLEAHAAFLVIYNGHHLSRASSVEQLRNYWWRQNADDVDENCVEARKWIEYAYSDLAVLGLGDGKVGEKVQRLKAKIEESIEWFEVEKKADGGRDSPIETF
ncbi:hypothetical protein CI109_101441 [Kwoniella shandongensis]|uniref:Uncharacterized protein n=1 Tax=Kwoniella shandongensis TaxID=1734106 RepID=A0A5M6BWP3_9TREE|nr:uncharacterized protein CI109_005136 [Kwoniella shandongensis]KAA5526560.1 hypothetical protein CI109_005136 [Kwoniella shandongensis]